MTRVGPTLAGVDTSSGECAKLACKTGSRTLHRHHIKHEAMWLGIWSGRRKGEKKFKEFVERYHAFEKGDWVRLCDNHHAEIHLIYDGIVNRDRRITGRPLSEYSWIQAERLMAKLKAACIEWLKKETSGMKPISLDELRSRRRKRRVRDWLRQ